jgi:hypothetical protein
MLCTTRTILTSRWDDLPKITVLKEELPQLFVDYHGEWPGAA